jgi:hypothetical protein
MNLAFRNRVNIIIRPSTGLWSGVLIKKRRKKLDDLKFLQIPVLYWYGTSTLWYRYR